MKHILLIILIVFLSFNTLTAQDFWEQLPVPENEQLFSIAVKDSNLIFIGTHNNLDDSKNLFRSTDFGQSWEKVLISTGTALSMVVSETGRIYAGTNMLGRLFYSDDNGDSWDSISFECRDNIVDLYCKGQDTVYMSKWSSYGSLLFRSTDAAITWDTIFFDYNSTEYVSDVLRTNSEETYIATRGYFENMGGVYKSTDNDSTWELIGLFNSMVSCLAMNSQGDLFAGSWGGVEMGNAGLYVMRNDSQEWVKIAGAQVSDVLVNSDDYIFFGSGFSAGIYYSTNGGNSFIKKSNGLGGGEVHQLEIDNKGFIYVEDGNLNRSLSTTVSNENIIMDIPQNEILVYPNPARSYINFKIKLPYSGNAIINITDFSGKIVIANFTIGLLAENKINIADFPAGFYCVNVVIENKTYKTQFVKL